MTESDLIPTVADPISFFEGWLAEAKKAEVNDPEAMALATATQDGKPSAHFEHNIALVNGKPELLSTFGYVYEALGIKSDEENEFRQKELVL